MEYPPVPHVFKTEQHEQHHLPSVESPLAHHPGDDNERRHFMLCSSGSGPLFTTYYETSFWIQLILQLSQAESAVHHAVVALESLHWRFMSSSQHDIAWNDSLNDYGLLQYNKAVADLIKYISKEGDNSQDIYFDMLRGSLRVQENTSSAV